MDEREWVGIRDCGSLWPFLCRVITGYERNKKIGNDLGWRNCY